MTEVAPEIEKDPAWQGPVTAPRPVLAQYIPGSQLVHDDVLAPLGE